MLLKTPLYEAHLSLGAKMGGFAGYDMPLYYNAGVMAEHEWVRRSAGLFDVSHMGQILVSGENAAQYFEAITPSDFQEKRPGRAQYTVLTNQAGGIIDDLIITKLDAQHFFAIVNAGCKDKDMSWMRQHLPQDLSFDVLQHQALLALQGPEAENVLRATLDIDTRDLNYMHLLQTKLQNGTPVYVSRLGYTGEDGFEISLPATEAISVWNNILSHGDVKPIGLAARDSLRLEMGYPLYGHDIDDATSPVEADIGWIISKTNQSFIGHERVLREKTQGPARKRIGLKLLDKGVAREGYEIVDETGRQIGAMTSGGFSPSLKESIGQAYVDMSFANPGQKIGVKVRDRVLAAEIVTMPFVKARTKGAVK